MEAGLTEGRLQLAQVIQQRGLVIAYCFYRYLKSVSLVLEEFDAVLEATGREELDKTRRRTHCRLYADCLVVVRGVANVFRRRSCTPREWTACRLPRGC
eukprot:scaffold56013_cov67-Phaeocystis_antarctica.AAC.3